MRCATTNSYDATTTLAEVCKLLPPTRVIIDDGLKTDKQYLNAAHRLLVRMQQDAKQLRKAFLQELRERIAMRKTPSKLSPEESLKCINKQLRSTANFGHIKKVLQPSTPSPLTKVYVLTAEQTVDPTTGQPTTIKRVEIVDTKAELESHILARNKKHFAQAEGTPFTEYPMNSMRSDNALDQYYDAEMAHLTTFRMAPSRKPR
jgi:hypothetical protein